MPVLEPMYSAYWLCFDCGPPWCLWDTRLTLLFITGWAPFSVNLAKNSSTPKFVTADPKNKGLYLQTITWSISSRLISPLSNSASSNKISYNRSSLISSWSLSLFFQCTDGFVLFLTKFLSQDFRHFGGGQVALIWLANPEVKKKK